VLSDHDFNLWCHQLDLSAEARQKIQDIRSNPPARNVYGGRANVCGSYPSKKLGLTIQFESHRVELARIIELEYDHDVLEYYDQPYGEVGLAYKAKGGRNVSVTYTPDFFVMRQDGAGWEECKPENELIQLAEKQPNRYHRDETGTWRCPPAEEYASRFGLNFRVWSDVGVSWVFQENVTYLDDYWRYEYPEINPSIVASVQQLVSEQRGISLAELLAADTGATADDINALIASQSVYVNLYRARFSNPHDVKIFESRDTALAYGQALEIKESLQPEGFQKFIISIGTRLTWDGQVWEVINTGNTKTSLQPADGPIMHLPNEQLDALIQAGEILPVQTKITTDSQQESIRDILRQTSPSTLKEAQQRYEAIQPYLVELSPTCPSGKTRRWMKAYRAAEKKYGNGFVGLIPQHQQKGNRRPKISPEIQTYMDAYIQKHYETIKQSNVTSVYGSFKTQLETEHPGWTAPSHQTFRWAVKKRSGPEQTRSRKGHRAAIQEEPMYWELDQKTPRHGSRPFEIAHIDHTPMDIELMASIEALSLCRYVVEGVTKASELAHQAWLSIMIDSFSRRILAAYITYEPPSYRTCMMVMRICVGRFKRLPQTLVVDNGPEFHSDYFEELVAFYQIMPKWRPPAYARFGTLVERLFGTNNEQFLYNLQGNTQARKERQTTKATDPKRNAVWNLPDLYKYLCTWLYEVYDNTVHPSLDQSPNEAYANGLAIGGKREHRRIEYDEVFKIMTLPGPQNGDTRKVQPIKGVRISNIWYWSNHFRSPYVEKQNVEVRHDPFNIGLAYAFVQKQWVQCTSSFFNILNGRTEKEVQLASEEIKKRKRQDGKRGEVSNRELALFLQDVEKHEELLKEYRKAIDNKAVLKLIDGGVSDNKNSEEQHLEDLSGSEEIEVLVSSDCEPEPEEEEEFEYYGRY
jgi:putative transposase